MLKRLFAACSFAVFALLAVSSIAAHAGTSPPAAAVAYHAPYFDAESAAQAHCPSDVVVWLNIPSGVYHYKGERWCARTKHGGFVCEKEAFAKGDRASRNGQ